MANCNSCKAIKKGFKSLDGPEKMDNNGSIKKAPQSKNERAQEVLTMASYQNVSFFCLNESCLSCSILPRVMKEGESKDGNSLFERTQLYAIS